MPALDVPRVAVLLADGDIATIRAFEPEDAEPTRELHRRASDASVYRRFFALDRKSGDRYVDHLLAASPDDTLALVAEHEGDIVAVAGYERIGPAIAEVAFFVDDRMQGKGIATLMLEHLAAVGRRRGIESFDAEVLVDNHPMIQVFRDAGFDLAQRTDREVLTLVMSTTATERAVAAADARERAAEARSLEPLLAPGVVAVAGAGRRRGGVGREILENIRAGDYAGQLYVIHPEAADVGGVPAYASFDQLPAPVDLLVVAVPAARVLQLVTEAAAAGTRSAIVITAGLADEGADGAQIQQEMVRVARRHGMRLVGPNCLGLLSTDPSIRLNATFATLTPPAGGLAIASQSGGVGIALLDAATRNDVGVASFVSLGNKADVSGNDLLAAWTDDPRVSAAALYLESFGNPRKFARLARRFAERKPLLATVGGRSASGQRAGQSHTAAAAAPVVAVDALCAQAGVIGVHDTEELVDVAHLLLKQPLPGGPRLGIVGNAGGVGVLAADAAQAAGLVVPEISPDVRARFGGAAGSSNPIDLGAAATPEGYDSAIVALRDSGEVDALLVVFAATRVGDSEQVTAAIARAAAGSPTVPIAAVLLGESDPPTSLGQAEVPVYRSAESAATAFAHASRYAAWRQAPRSDRQPVEALLGGATQSLVRDILTAAPDGRWLAPPETSELLGAYGVDAPIGEIVHSADEAAAAAERIGFPVVVKAADATIVHRTDRGLVLVGLRTADEVRSAYARIAAVLETDAPLVLLQPQVDEGVEIAVGAVRDPTFGPMVMVAAGGIATDVWDDRIFLLPPVTADDVARAVRSLRVAPLLLGFRGSTPGDIAELERVILAVARLADEVPEVAELDINPVVVMPDGVSCIDGKLRLAPAAALDAGVPRRLADPR
jgi:acyl-CoA synthetase (NDP forming)/RimJ/RimL family protein N-acetyltransferase